MAHPSLDQECIGLLISTCRFTIREHLSDVWNRRWVTRKACNHTRCIWPSVNVERSRYLVNLPRKVVSLVLAIFTVSKRPTFVEVASTKKRRRVFFISSVVALL